MSSGTRDALRFGGRASDGQKPGPLGLSGVGAVVGVTRGDFTVGAAVGAVAVAVGVVAVGLGAVGEGATRVVLARTVPLAGT